MSSKKPKSSSKQSDKDSGVYKCSICGWEFLSLANYEGKSCSAIGCIGSYRRKQ